MTVGVKAKEMYNFVPRRCKRTKRAICLALIMPKSADGRLIYLRCGKAYVLEA